MPIRALAERNGVYRPDEMVLLGRVFDRCVNASDDVQKREQLASRVIANYLAGVRDEEELVTLSRYPLGR